MVIRNAEMPRDEKELLAMCPSIARFSELLTRFARAVTLGGSSKESVDHGETKMNPSMPASGLERN